MDKISNKKIVITILCEEWVENECSLEQLAKETKEILPQCIDLFNACEITTSVQLCEMEEQNESK